MHGTTNILPMIFVKVMKVCLFSFLLRKVGFISLSLEEFHVLGEGWHVWWNFGVIGRTQKEDSTHFNANHWNTFETPRPQETSKTVLIYFFFHPYYEEKIFITPVVYFSKARGRVILGHFIVAFDEYVMRSSNGKGTTLLIIADVISMQLPTELHNRWIYL